MMGRRLPSLRHFADRSPSLLHPGEQGLTFTSKLVVQRNAQALDPTPDPGFGRSQRAFNPFGDLLLVQALKIGHLDDFTLLG